jgi:xanthine dehydrogenase YagR molybdenum-binding subunit
MSCERLAMVIITQFLATHLFEKSVDADAPPVMDVIFVEEHDPHVNPLGVKGLAELAIVGVASAITSAVFHATGKRVRELPITPDKLLEAV